MSLYQITTEMLSLIEAFDRYGHASEEAAAAIREHAAAISQAFDAKADDYAALIRVAETRAAARNEESERMRKLAESDEHLAEKLRLMLVNAMQTTGRTKVQTARFALSVRRNGGKQPIVVTDEAAIPAQFRVPVVKEVFDRDGLRESLEKGESIPGVVLGERGVRLDLK